MIQVHEIPNPKNQIPNKFQLPKLQLTKREFWSLKIWLLFDYWCLEIGYYKVIHSFCVILDWNSIPSSSQIRQRGLVYREAPEKPRGGTVQRRLEIAYVSSLPGFGR
jgi:hypothetical protein